MVRTILTDAFRLEYPIVLAPMGGVAGGILAAAVSNAGGLGLVGGGYGDIAWLRRELPLVASGTSRPWGAGLITWNITKDALSLILSYRPAAVMLSFGNPAPHVELIKQQSVKLICQVQTLNMARQAKLAGADFIVAQGAEAGGHGAERGLFTLLPAVIDAVQPTPVIAAGGIADGRGLAAAMIMGACGAMVGTRFYASHEALGHARIKSRLVEANAEDTARTRVFDTIRGFEWPQEFTGRAIKNGFYNRWHGRESELAANVGQERVLYERAVEEADTDTRVIFAGEALDLIRDIRPAADIVRSMAAEADGLLAKATSI